MARRLAILNLLLACVQFGAQESRRTRQTDTAKRVTVAVLDIVNGRDYIESAREVTQFTRETFLVHSTGQYRQHVSSERPAFVWPAGVWLTALAGAARQDENWRQELNAYFEALEQYWNSEAEHAGYEPLPTCISHNDRYYDDNAWLAISFLEAFQFTGDEKYEQRAKATLDFVLSGEDDLLEGGIWWHEQHKDGTKNTCVNAPAAVACLAISKHVRSNERQTYIAKAASLVNWTVKNLQAEDGLFHDRIVVSTGKVKEGKRTYNSGLMIRAMLGLYKATGESRYLDQAKRISRACKKLTRNDSDVFRDHVQWSHLLVEADIELYRVTHEDYLLRRAAANANYFYQTWQTEKPDDLMTNAATARLLWLMADLQTELNSKSQNLKENAR